MRLPKWIPCLVFASCSHLFSFSAWYGSRLNPKVGRLPKAWNFYSSISRSDERCRRYVSGKQIVITVPSGKVTRRVDEDLNLTCRVTAKETYSISWDIPQNKQLQVDRIKTEDKFNEQSVTIYRLGEVDTGMYTCTAQHDKTVLKQIVYVSVSSQGKIL